MKMLPLISYLDIILGFCIIKKEHIQKEHFFFMLCFGQSMLWSADMKMIRISYAKFSKLKKACLSSI